MAITFVQETRRTDMSSFRDFQYISRAPSTKFFYSFYLAITLISRSFYVIADCGNMQVLEKGGISCSLIKDILRIHNELRESVAKGLVKNQPAASDMRELYWDKELANGAQNWANQCTFAHNEDKERQVARFKVGQNVAQTKSKHGPASTEKEFRKQIKNWFDEHKIFEFGPIRRLEDLQTIGHYTQIAWANTYLVGCGFSRYRTSKNVTHRLYVCNYGPTGNILGKEPYQRGNQKCPKDFVESKRYRKLCSLKKSRPNPCGANQEEKDTHVKNDNLRYRRKEKKLHGRRFVSSSFLPNFKEGTAKDYDKSNEYSQVTRNKHNIIFNIFFNFNPLP